jgi:Type VI secretion system/phage-baseplate injector OB domain
VSVAPDLQQLVVDLAGEVRDRYWGKYRGIVDEVLEDDPPGRIIAKVPSVYGDDVKSPPALPAFPYAGDGHGLVALPEVGDGVWIEFEAGDVSHPIWTGCWFANGELPDPAGPQQRVLVTSKNLRLVFDDDAEEIHISHPDGAEITMDSSSLTLQFGETVKVVISSSGIDINDGAFKVSAL